MISIVSSLNLKNRLPRTKNPKPITKNEKLKAAFFVFCSSFFVFGSPFMFASAPDYPVFVAKLPNPSDYTLFANGGWDGNWYVGFNTCWIKKLPAIPAGHYQRAFIGVKLGRMKLASTAGKKPWEISAVPGSVYMAIASTTAWKPDQSYLMADTKDIPLEGDYESAVEGSGESQWFWTEVPLKQINFAGDNFLALWSPTPELLSVSSSPVVAAGWGGKEVDAWLTHDVQGAPPQDPSKTGPGISYFTPAMALKLIPQGNTHPVTVRMISWQNGSPDHLKPVITADVSGDSIERAWIEYEKDTTWVRVGRPLWQAPYVFSLDQTRLPHGRVKLRVAAANVWEDISTSEPFTVEVSPIPAKP